MLEALLRQTIEIAELAEETGYKVIFGEIRPQGARGYAVNPDIAPSFFAAQRSAQSAKEVKALMSEPVAENSRRFGAGRACGGSLIASTDAAIERGRFRV
jgi:hypothetical protein